MTTSGDPTLPDYRRSPAFPTIAEAEARLRARRHELSVRGWSLLAIVSGLLIPVTPWAWLGVGAAALGFFVSNVFIGYHTLKIDEPPTYPPTAPFDERNRYIRDRFNAPDA